MENTEKVVYTGVLKTISVKDASKYIIESVEAFKVYGVDVRMPVSQKPDDVELGDSINFALHAEKPLTTWVEKAKRVSKRKHDAVVDEAVEEAYVGTVTKQSLKNPSLYIVECPVVTEWYGTEARLPEALWPDGLELGEPITFRVKETPSGKPLIVWAERSKPSGPKQKAPLAPSAKKVRGPATTADVTAEVRMQDAESAIAAWELHGSVFAGSKLSVIHHPSTDDGLKLLVSGLMRGADWKELKAHFKQAGEVAFVKISDQGTPGPQKGQDRDGAAITPGPQRRQDRDGAAIGEIRFTDKTSVDLALGLYGSVCNGVELQVELDAKSTDGTKVRVLGLPAGFSSKLLKQHFEEVGEVAFCKVNDLKKG